MPVRDFIRSNPPTEMAGTCEMCGRYDQHLQIMLLYDYIGWTCCVCIDRASKYRRRRFVAFGEYTEPIE